MLFTGPHKDAGYRALAFSFWYLHSVDGWKGNSYYPSTTRSFEMLCSRYSKTCLKQPLKKKTKIGFQDQLLLNAGQKYCRSTKGSILQYCRPLLSYHLSLRSLFCLFLSGCLRQVLL